MVNSGDKRFAETTYEGKEFCIIDCLQYKGRKYYFIVNKSEMEDKNYNLNDINYSFSTTEFIYKVYDRYFDKVTDEKIFGELCNMAIDKINRKIAKANV